MLPLRLRLACIAIALLTIVACTLPFSLPPFNTRDKSSEETKSARVAADGVNTFAADLYSRLRTGNGNLIVSPYSISAALALTAAGAQGKTREEMETVLHLRPGTKVGATYSAIAQSATRAYPRSKHGPELLVANSLWLHKGNAWKKEYLALAQDDFGAMLSGADFAREPEAARGRINKWIETRTRDHIKDLVPPGSINTDTRIVIANAIYFKADWAEPFEKKNSKPEDFTLPNGQKVRAPIMYQQDTFGLLETDAIQVLKLPYSGKSASMFVLLPRTADGLPALEQQLTAETLAKWTADTNGADEVKVWLPKFKFTVPTELTGVLQKMGMSEAFDVSKANFKGMAESPEGLYIGSVIHKAFVDLDEKGTEAAAATAVVTLAGAVPGSPQPRIKEFRADHPFLFVIKHEGTGAVLFMGRVLDPTR